MAPYFSPLGIAPEDPSSFHPFPPPSAGGQVACERERGGCACCVQQLVIGVFLGRQKTTPPNLDLCPHHDPPPPNLPNTGRFQGVLEACAPSCELRLSLAKLGEPTTLYYQNIPDIHQVPAKVPNIHQSSGEGAFCMSAVFRTCPTNRSSVHHAGRIFRIHELIRGA